MRQGLAELARLLDNDKIVYAEFWDWLVSNRPPDIIGYRPVYTSPKVIGEFKGALQARHEDLDDAYERDRERFHAHVELDERPPHDVLADTIEPFGAVFKYVAASQLGFYDIMMNLRREAVNQLRCNPHLFTVYRGREEHLPLTEQEVLNNDAN